MDFIPGISLNSGQQENYTVTRKVLQQIRKLEEHRLNEMKNYFNFSEHTPWKAPASVWVNKILLLSVDSSPDSISNVQHLLHAQAYAYTHKLRVVIVEEMQILSVKKRK